MPVLLGRLASARTTATGAGSRRSERVAVLLVLGTALVVRVLLLVWAERRGLGEGYDPSTYYVAADALLHGHWPYSGDVVLLHPPLVVLAELPFAALGWVTTAHTGFVAACLAFGLLGSLACAGVVVVTRQWGMPLWAATAGGLFVAVWTSTAEAQATARLEPLGDVLLVLGLVALGAGPVPRRRLVLAGVAFGLLVLVKVWWVLPVGLLLLLLGVRRRAVRDAVVVGVSALVTAALVLLPFLLVAGTRLVRLVLLVQVHRSDLQAAPGHVGQRMPAWVRIDRITGVAGAASHYLTTGETYRSVTVHLVGLAVLAVFGVLAALALRTRLGRWTVPLLVAQLVALLAAPVYFIYYGDFLGVALGLTLAAGLAALARSAGRPAARGVALALPLVAAVAIVITVWPTSAETRDAPDVARLSAAARDVPCVLADTPRALIALDAVDRSFSPGCRDVVDLQGLGYGGGADPTARLTAMRPNAAWIREVSAYLCTGQVYARGSTGFGGYLDRYVAQGPVLASSGDITVFKGCRSVR